MSGVYWSREKAGEGAIAGDTVTMTREQFQSLYDAIALVMNPPKDRFDMSEPSARAWLNQWLRAWNKRLRQRRAAR